MSPLQNYPTAPYNLALRVADLAFRKCDYDLAYITNRLNADLAANPVTTVQVRDAIILLVGEKVVTYSVETTPAAPKGLNMLAPVRLRWLDGIANYMRAAHGSDDSVACEALQGLIGLTAQEGAT